jgi:hypothetical protein
MKKVRKERGLVLQNCKLFGCVIIDTASCNFPQGSSGSLACQELEKEEA